MHPTNAACGEHFDTGQRGQMRRGRHGGGPVGPPRQQHRQVANAGLGDVLRGAHALKLGLAQAHFDFAVQYGDGGGHSAVLAHTRFYGGGHLQIERAWQAVRYHSGLQRHYRAALAQGQCHFRGCIHQVVQFSVLILHMVMLILHRKAIN
jgi:hypothetical protein